MDQDSQPLVCVWKEFNSLGKLKISIYKLVIFIYIFLALWVYTSIFSCAHESCLLSYLKKCFFFGFTLTLIHDLLLSPSFLFISLLIVGGRVIDAWLLPRLVFCKGMNRHEPIHRWCLIYLPLIQTVQNPLLMLLGVHFKTWYS